MRDQAIAPRFDSRPAWWIFREILRRMDALAPSAKEALDFETIEELWNYQLDGTGVTVAEMREQGFVSLANAPRLIPRGELKFPTPSGKIEIESAILKQAGLPSLPPYAAKAAPADDRFLLLIGRTATLTHGQSFNNPLLNEISAGTGALDPPRPRPAAGYRRRRYRRGPRGVGAGSPAPTSAGSRPG